MLKWSRKTATNHIAQHVEDHHIGVLQQMVLLEQLHCLAGYVATAASTSWRATRLHTHHSVVSLEHEVFWLQLFSVKIYGFENINHRGHHRLGEGEGGIVLGIAADLKHPFPQLGEGGREVGGGGGFADTALAINGDYQGARLDLHRGVLVNLEAAFTVEAGQGCGHGVRVRESGNLEL